MDKDTEKQHPLDSIPVYHHAEIMNELLRGGRDDLFTLRSGHFTVSGVVSVVTYKRDGHTYEIRVERKEAKNESSSDI